MLHSIRSRLITLAGVPLLLLVIIQMTYLWKEYENTRRMEPLTQLGVVIGALVHETQIERGLTSGYLTSQGNDFFAEMKSRRNWTNQKFAEFNSFIDTLDIPAYGETFIESVENVRTILGQIQNFRSLVDTLKVSTADAIAFYSALNDAYIKLIYLSVELTPNPELSLLRDSYLHFMQAKENAGIERGLINSILTAGKFTHEELIRFQTLLGFQHAYFLQFEALANQEQLEFYTTKMSAPAAREVVHMRNLLLNNAQSSSLNIGITPKEAFARMTGMINLMKDVEDRLAADLQQHVNTLTEKGHTHLIQMSVFTVGLILGVLAFALYMARGISIPLRQAVSFAEKIAANDLKGDFRQTYNGELGILTGSLNKMAQNLRTSISELTRHEQELEHNNQLLERVFATTDSMLAYMDRDFNFIRVNKGFATADGRDQDFFIGKNHFDLYPDEENQNIFQGVVETREPFIAYAKAFEYTHAPERGISYWDWSLIPAIDHQGEVEGLVLTLADVTERVTMEQALQQSEARYEDLYNNAPDMYISVDAETACIIQCNLTLSNNLGYRKEEIVDQPVYEIYHPDCRAEAQRAHAEFIKTGEVKNTELQLRQKDGTIIDVSLNASAVRDEDGNIQYSRSCLRDITERKAAEKALIESRNSLAVAQHIAKLGNWDLDITAGTLTWSDEVYQIFGVDRETFSLSFESFMQLVHPNDREDVQKAINAAKYEHHPFSIDYRIIRPDGELRVVHEEAKDFSDMRGKPLRRVGTVQDITRQKQIEKALNQAKETAESANRAKSVFLANMSHELRTPLNAILGFAHLMNDSNALTPKQQRNINIIISSGEHLLSLINNVLDMSKIESGHTSMNECNFDIFHLLNDLENMFMLSITGRDLSLSFECADDVPSIICTDETKLRQVLINLLSNALKFTQKGWITLRVKVDHLAVRDYQTNLHLVFEVEDTGPGIAQEDMETIFTPFEQTHCGKAAPGGTGLGLSISKHYIQLMGGDISVSSRLGKGSRFRFYLPVKISENATAYVD